MEGQIKEILDLILALFNENPLVVQALASLMAIRLVVKPYREVVLPLLKKVVQATPSKKDDEILDKVEKSKAAKVVNFLLDLLFSIKK